MVNRFLEGTLHHLLLKGTTYIQIRCSLLYVADCEIVKAIIFTKDKNY